MTMDSQNGHVGRLYSGRWSWLLRILITAISVGYVFYVYGVPI